MKVNKFNEASSYIAANHEGSISLRLQGHEAGGSKNHWIGLSHYLPGGRAGPDSSPVEKSYVVISGALTVIVDGQEFQLQRFDSCTIAPGETREAVNRSNEVCTLLVVIPYLPGS